MQNRKRFENNLPESNGKYCLANNAIPVRFVQYLSFLGFLGFNSVYAHKVVLSVTIVAMVGHSNTTKL